MVLARGSHHCGVVDLMSPEEKNQIKENNSLAGQSTIKTDQY